MEALSGAVLREGTRTTLAVSVTQEVGLVFVPQTLEIERGRGATFRVTTEPALRAGRSVEVRLDTGAPGFGFGPSFGPGFGNGEDREQAQLLIVLSTDNPWRIVEVRASTRVGARSTLTGTISGEGVSASAAELGLRSVTPRVSVSLTPDSLALTMGSSARVSVGLSDYTLLDDQEIVIRLQTDGDSPPGLTVSPPEVVLSGAVQKTSVVVTATTAAGISENLTATATGDVLETSASLGVLVTQEVRLRFTPTTLGVPFEGFALFTVETVPALGRERSVEVSLPLPEHFQADGTTDSVIVSLGENAASRVLRVSLSAEANLGSGGVVAVDRVLRVSEGVLLLGVSEASAAWEVIPSLATVSLTPDLLRLEPEGAGTVTLSLESDSGEAYRFEELSARLEVSITGPGLEVDRESVELSAETPSAELVVTASADAEDGVLNVTAAADSRIELAAPASLEVQVSRGVQLRIRVFLEGALE